MKAARVAGIIATTAAIMVIVAAAARSEIGVYVAAAVGALSAAASVWLLPRETVAFIAPPAPTPRPKPEPTATVLIATLQEVEEGSERLVADLQRVLAGIIADERGKIDRAEPHTIVALFTRADHAAAAVHAARRMLSNVDAVSRRLGHTFRITIAVHTAPRGEEAISTAARIQEAATDAVPIVVSAPAAAALGNELERIDTVAADGWTLDVFTIPPAQKRLPGF